MADPVVQLSNAISTTLNDLLSNNFISSSVLLGLSFYAYKAAPALPSFVEELFENVFFQIFVGFMVLYMNTQNFMLSLVVSVVFVYGMKMFSGLKEGMFGGDNGRSDPPIHQVDIGPWSQSTIDPDHGRPNFDPDHGRPSHDRPIHGPNFDPSHGRPNFDPIHGRPSHDRPIHGPNFDPIHDLPNFDPSHGRPNFDPSRGRDDALSQEHRNQPLNDYLRNH